MDDQEPLPDWDADGEIVGPASVPDQFADALAQLGRAADTLTRLGSDPDLVLAGRDRLIGWARDLEQARNLLACPDQVLINLMEASGCRIDGPLGLFSSPQAYLHALHGIPWGAARARVRAAGLLAPKPGMTGHQVPARYPVLAQAQAAGDLSPDRVDLIAKALLKWEKLLPVDGNQVSAETLGLAEEVLARQARVFGGAELEKVIGRVWWRPPKIIDPDQKPILNTRHRGTPLIT